MAELFGRVLTFEQLKGFVEAHEVKGEVKMPKEWVLELIDKVQEYENYTTKEVALLNRHIFHKMCPSCCTDEITVFESREEYDNFIKLKHKIENLIK